MASISGEANETGFEIQISDKDFNIQQSTKNYEKLEDEYGLVLLFLFKQWHGCEHKAVNLLQSGKALTLNNFSKTSKFSLYDGASYYCSLILFTLFFSCIYLYFSWGVIFNLLIWICLCLAIWLTPLKKIGLWLFSPLAILIQLWTTAEPEDWQLEQGLEVIKKIKTEYEIRKLIFPFSIK